MRNRVIFISLVSITLAAGPMAQAWSQSANQGLSQGQQPSEQQIEAFCANWGQLSDSEKRQYRDQYERYCRDEPVFGQPVAPEPQTTIMQPADPQQQPSQQQPSQQPERPDEPQAPEAPEPELELEPAKPEPVIPEPEPLRVDLVGELALAGPLAREPGERQRLRVTVENQGSDVPGSNRLWARVFLSDRQVSRRGASAFTFSGARQGRPVRLPGVPEPGQSREVSTEITLPAGTPDGNYWWCVRVDTRQQVEETDEGNNIACARKVVALGGEQEPESKLSAAFGSKVEELKEREDVDPASKKLDKLEETMTTLPDDVEPTGGDESLPPPAVRSDLEIVDLNRLGPPGVTERHEGFGLGDGRAGRQVAVYRRPYLFRLRVRNNGIEPARFLPYYIFEGDEQAHVGVMSGFGTLGGDGERGVSIDPGRLKWVTMFVDLRPSALSLDRMLRLERGDVDLNMRLFLGAVDAPGDRFGERIYRDAILENHVEETFVEVVAPILYRVVIRSPRFNIVDSGDDDGIGELQYVALRHKGNKVERYLRSGCALGGRGEGNATGGSGWDGNHLLVRDGNRISVDFNGTCGVPEGGDDSEAYPFVAYAPLGSWVEFGVETREVDGGRWSPYRVTKRAKVLDEMPVSPEDCRSLPYSSEYYNSPHPATREVNESGSGVRAVSLVKLCIDERVPEDLRTPEIEPIRAR